MTNLSFYDFCGYRREDGTWKYASSCALAASLKQPMETLANCAPENVINGVSRIQSPEVYEWVSDPKQSLPQWLQLELAEPTQINQVSVVFNTDLTNPGTCWNSKIPNVPLCVKRYTVEVLSGGSWQSVAEIDDNFMRKRI